MKKKMVSVAVPLYNEAEMIEEICDRVENVFKTLDQYDYEIVFFDDGSTDGTKAEIDRICAERAEVKCVRYTRNFGYLKNTFYCMQQSKGDCAVLLHADLQNPPELIPEFLKKWEDGAKVVQGVKKKSRENRFMFFLRSVFYFIMIRFFGINIKAHATEFELFDRSFIDILKSIDINKPFLRGIVSEYAQGIEYVYYVQDARKRGKSKFKFKSIYEFAFCGITQYSRVLPRRIIITGVLLIIGLLIESFAVFLPHAKYADPLIISNSIMIRCCGLVLCFILILAGIIWEYVIASATNSSKKPLVVEKERIKY